MKNIIFIALSSILLVSCNNEINKGDYLVMGNFLNKYSEASTFISFYDSQVKYIHFQNNIIDGNNFFYIEDIKDFKLLHSIKILHSKIIFPTTILKNSNIETIYFSYCHIDINNLNAFVDKLPYLKNVTLYSCKIIGDTTIKISPKIIINNSNYGKNFIL